MLHVGGVKNTKYLMEDEIKKVMPEWHWEDVDVDVQQCHVKEF